MKWKCAFFQQAMICLAWSIYTTILYVRNQVRANAKKLEYVMKSPSSPIVVQTVDYWNHGNCCPTGTVGKFNNFMQCILVTSVLQFRLHLIWFKRSLLSPILSIIIEKTEHAFIIAFNAPSVFVYFIALSFFSPIGVIQAGGHCILI